MKLLNTVIISILFLTNSEKANSQFFEGRLSYMNIYSKPGTQEHLFDPVTQVEYYKSSMHKIEIPNAADGQLEWQIENYKSQKGYSKISDIQKDTSYFVTDEPVTYQKDGITFFKKPDSINKKIIHPIREFELCNNSLDTTVFKESDKIFNFGGLTSKVILEYRGEALVRLYFYCDSIKMNPIICNCSLHKRFYEITNGSLITKFVNLETVGYTYVYELSGIEAMEIDDKIFSLPSLDEK